METKNKINEDLISAMKERRSFDVEVLRGLNAAFKNKEIELRTTGEAVELSEDQIMDVLSKEVKKRKDSVELYRQGDREDLAEKEEKEIVVIQKYLPEQMSAEEIERIVDEEIETLRQAGSDVAFSDVMKAAMAKLKGRADGKEVAEVIKKSLSR